VAQLQKDNAAAADFYQQSLVMCRTLGAKELMVLNLSGLTIVGTHQQRGAQVAQSLQEGLALAHQLDVIPLKLVMLLAAIHYALAQGRALQAAQWAGLLLHHPSGSQELVRDVERVLSTLATRLGEKGLAQAIIVGCEFDLDQVLDGLTAISSAA
jgi:hypothetical protein